MKLLSQIKDTLKNKVLQKLFENFISLSIFQGLTFIVELITLPYLTNTLGAVNYGLISFALSFILFFQIISEYGFNHSGTRAVSKYRDDPQKLEKIYNSINSARIILSGICFVSIVIIIFVFDKFRENSIIYLLLFGLVIQSVLIPVWFFRGIEKMKYITIIDLFGKIFLLFCIFSFINTESEYFLYPLFIFITSIFIGLISQIFLYKKFKLSFKLTPIKDVKYQFSSGFFMFLVYFSTSIITNVNPFLLGLLTNYTTVGIFSAGYKIIQIFVLLISLITTTVFPHIVKLISESNDDIKHQVNIFIKKVLLIIILVGVLSFLFLFIFADFIANLLFVAEYNDTIKVIRILSLAPLLIGIGHTLTLQVLVPLEYDSLVAQIYGFSAIVDVILCFILIPLYGYIGLCIAILATRFITIIFSTVGIRRNDVKLNLLNL